MFLTAGPLLRQYFVVVIVNLNMLVAGMALAWVSPVLLKLGDAQQSPLGTALTQEQGSWVVSVPALSGLIGAFAAAFISNRIGRKYALVFGAVPRVLGWILLTLASEVWMLYVGRLTVGLSDGLAFVVVPMYASEVATKEVRGSIGTILQLLCSTGILFMLSVGPFMQYFPLTAICTAAAVVAALPLFFLPDSPQYYHIRGQREKALKALTTLRGSSILAEENLKEYETSNDEEKLPIMQILKSRECLKAIFIVVILAIGTQATGFNAVTFYLQTVLVSTGTSVPSEYASMAIGSIQLLSSLCATFIIDKFGRKPILAVTLVGMCIGLAGLGVFFKLSEQGWEISGFLQYLPLASLLLTVCSYSAGLGSLLWPVNAELFSGSARAVGMSIALLTTQVFIFLSTRYFSALTTALGPSLSYWIFSFNTLLLTLFILFCVPETKGRSFAQIQLALGVRGDVPRINI